MDAQRGIARRMVVGLPLEGRSPTWEKDFAAYPPAGVIVFRRDFHDLGDLRRLTARLRELARPRRLFVAMDEEGGFVSQLAGHLTVPPNALLLARGAAPGDIEWLARVTGERLRALGVDWVLAPVADIHCEPANPVIGPRAFGTDAATAARGVAEAVRGFRAARVACCIKHFPGHGATALDSHLALPVCGADRATLERRELEPFRAGLAADAVMTAHVVYPALDPERPATFSRAIAHDLLRGMLGFRGVCVTDALEMKGAAEGRGPFEAGRQALAAGCDLLLYAFHDDELRRVRLELARALVDGGMERAGFDAARARLAALDASVPVPTAEELARPLESLTPPELEARLERIIERGIVVRGALPASSIGEPWRVEAPGFPFGAQLGGDLAAAGVPLAGAGAGVGLVAEASAVPLAGDGAGVELVAVAGRVPLPGAEIERLRALARARPTVLVGLQNDGFLDAVPEASVRLSAADATPLTRRLVARMVARMARSGARA
ncbi:MAG: glycoside hydrolase family 3 protein [Candidatus Eisenbacteria bacterium]|nr:glycoside hydrolase family 3 protein [Candidatus Eisenbacteria bacterium]